MNGRPERRERILIVDDVAENRDILCRRLRRLGFQNLHEAEDGVQALAAIGRDAYDLVLLDIMMPHLDGFGVLEHLKDTGVTDLPVIVISALNEMEPVVRCVELGAEDFIFKPFNPTLLRARVLATLEKKALRDLTREELRRKRLELHEARSLQLSLAPPAFSGSVAGRSLSVDVMLEPALEVGGDLVDHFLIGDDLIVLVLGDVSDKGAGAALMMARTHAMFRSLATRPDADALFRQPERAMGIVNTALAEGNAAVRFVTLLLAAFEPATGRLTYVRAGHIPPFHSQDGTVSRLRTLGGPPLGIDAPLAFRPDTIVLKPGDRVLIVTDGVTEAHGPDDGLYGEDNVATFLAGSDPSEAAPLERLLRQVRTHEAGRPAFDDIAAILLTVGSFGASHAD